MLFIDLLLFKQMELFEKKKTKLTLLIHGKVLDFIHLWTKKNVEFAFY